MTYSKQTDINAVTFLISVNNVDLITEVCEGKDWNRENTQVQQITCFTVMQLFKTRKTQQLSSKI